MKTVKIKDLEIGSGLPKIAVPITGRDEASILEQARAIAALPADLIEWRLDWYEQGSQPEAVLSLLEKLRTALDGRPILVTFRSAAEGGQSQIAPRTYRALLLALAKSAAPDAIDLQIESDPQTVRMVLNAAHENRVPVIASWHQFESTPDLPELSARLEQMKQAGADVCKIAVMPQSGLDVTNLMAAGLQAASMSDAVPVVAISMGEQGMISRMIAETIGSAITFGSASVASAPGQIEVRMLRSLLESLHEL